MIDFSRAFDAVDHAILLTKFIGLNLRDNITNWTISFLRERTQCVNLMVFCLIGGIYKRYYLDILCFVLSFFRFLFFSFLCL